MISPANGSQTRRNSQSAVVEQMNVGGAEEKEDEEEEEENETGIGHIDNGVDQVSDKSDYLSARPSVHPEKE